MLVYNTVLSAGDVEVLYGGRQRTSDGPYPRAGNLVAGVHLDEGRGTTVADFSGHGNDGTLHGGATWGPGRGVVQHARAMQFDGTRYATLPQSTKFTSSDFTVSLWFKPTKDHESQFLFMRGFADRDQPGDIGLKINPDGGGLDFAVRTADSQWLFGWPKSSLRGAFKVNQWNHVVVSRRGGARPMATLDTCTMWINGVRVGTEVAMNTDIGDTPNTNPFIVGGMMTDNGVHDMFQGALDEFRIFHRCLSDAEIATLYRGGDVLDSGDSRRSGDSGQNVADSLFSNNHDAVTTAGGVIIHRGTGNDFQQEANATAPAPQASPQPYPSPTAEPMPTMTTRKRGTDAPPDRDFEKDAYAFDLCFIRGRNFLCDAKEIS